MIEATGPGRVVDVTGVDGCGTHGENPRSDGGQQPHPDGGLVHSGRNSTSHCPNFRPDNVHTQSTAIAFARTH